MKQTITSVVAMLLAVLYSVGLIAAAPGHAASPADENKSSSGISTEYGNRLCRSPLKVRLFSSRLTTSLPFPQAQFFPDCQLSGMLCQACEDDSFLLWLVQNQEYSGSPQSFPDERTSE